MARILVATNPLSGHVNPAIPIVRKLVARGHEVWWYTGAAFQAKIEATGAHFVPVKSSLDLSLTDLPSAFPEISRLQGVAQVKAGMKHAFIDQAPGHYQDCLQILKEFPADIMLTDTLFVAANLISEKTGVIWANHGDSVLGITSRDTAPFGTRLPPNQSLPGQVRNRFLNFVVSKLIFREVNQYYDKMRQELGFSKSGKFFFEALPSPYLYLQGTVPSFEYPRRDLPSQVHFVGPFIDTPATQFTPPAWWDDLKGDRPVVHVTQGTVNNNNDDLLVPTLKALAGEDVLVVATTGGQPVETVGLASLPPNSRVAPFIPHANLLPYVDVVITNGGYGGVQIALAHGIPLVVAGGTEDKPEVAARIEWSGVGINLKTKNPSPEQLREAVAKIRSEPGYREKARQIQAEMARHDAATESALLLEELIATRQPLVSSPQLAGLPAK
jgi:UDP:flavonoid glycosyltransferase YjiC (YdhE family)